MNTFKFLIIFVLVLSCFGCVSKKKFVALEAKLEQLMEEQASKLEDEDGDGVLDILDKEPNTPKGCPVDTHGMTLDSDYDGVPDCDDKEPYSCPGCSVDADGVGSAPKVPSLTEEDIMRIINELNPPQASFDPENLDNLRFKEFTLPASSYSTEHIFEIAEVFPRASTLGDIGKELSQVLRDAGFKDNNEDNRFYYFQLKEYGKFKGFAVVTEFEQIVKSGEFLVDRFSETVEKKKPASFWELLVPPLNQGHFRCFAFLVAVDYYGGESDKIYTKKEAAEEYKRGEKELPGIIASQPVTGHKLRVLVYEYAQREDEDDGHWIPKSRLPGKEHLEKATIRF